MIKVMWAADRRFATIPDRVYYRWWHDVHGEEFAALPGVRQYAQHHTLAEVRAPGRGVAHWNSDTKADPTRDGLSIAWFDDFDAVRDTYRLMRERRARWSPSLFARHTMDVVVGGEHVVVDGPTTPEMVKGVYIFERRPDLSVEDFQEHWLHVHGPLWAAVPGVRRYVQTHPTPEAYAQSYDPAASARITHDGYSEVWFDDLDALRAAVASPERQAASDDGSQLLTYSTMSIVIGRETWITSPSPTP